MADPRHGLDGAQVVGRRAEDATEGDQPDDEVERSVIAAMPRNGSPNDVACAMSASATKEIDRNDRKLPILVKASL